MVFLSNGYINAVFKYFDGNNRLSNAFVRLVIYSAVSTLLALSLMDAKRVFVYDFHWRLIAKKIRENNDFMRRVANIDPDNVGKWKTHL